MQKLVDIFNTKYFPLHYVKDLEYFINLAVECLDNPTKKVVSDLETVKAAIESFKNNRVIEIDIAEAHFIPETISVLQQSTQKGVILSDSENTKRDAILVENRRRTKLSYEVTPLPKLKDIDNLPNYILSLSKDTTYVTDNMPLSLAIPLVSLIAVYNPEVKIDMGDNYDRLFTYVNNNIILEDFIYIEYNYIVGNTIYRDKFDTNGTIYVPGTGIIDYERFRRQFNVLPTAFGEEVLALKKEWQVLQNAAIDDIKYYLRNRRTSITDIFPGR